MASLIGLFRQNINIALSPRESFSSLKPTSMPIPTVILYIVFLGIIPGLGGALHYGYLNPFPSDDFLRDNYYYSLEEFRGEQIMELKIALYSIFVAIAIILLQREVVHLAVRQENPDVSKDEVTQVIFAGITFPYIVGFTLVFGQIGYMFLALASLYGFYLIYAGFLYFVKTEKELAFKAVGLFFIVGSALGIIVRAIVTLSYL